MTAIIGLVTGTIPNYPRGRGGPLSRAIYAFLHQNEHDRYAIYAMPASLFSDRLVMV